MSRPALVVASGRTLWTDLQAVPAATREAAAWLAVNDLIVVAPRVHHAVSHHREKLPHWSALRTHAACRGPREPGILLHSSAAGPGIDRAWPQFRAGGSSALLAVRIALALGHAPVLVAGVPLDAGGYLWSDPFEVCPGERAPGHRDFARYRGAWVTARDELAGRVRGTSGFLRELLGGLNG